MKLNTWTHRRTPIEIKMIKGFCLWMFTEYGSEHVMPLIRELNIETETHKWTDLSPNNYTWFFYRLLDINLKLSYDRRTL